MSNILPTVVFFAGACADPSCFDLLAAIFHRAGYPTVYHTALSLNPSDPASTTTLQDAENARRTTILPLLENGKELIVVVHSYGGVVGGQAAAGLSKASRLADGEKGGIVGLLYIVGNIVLEGETLLQAVGGDYPAFIKTNHPTKGLAVIEPAIETLYGDAPASRKAELEAAMIPHAMAAFETPATAPAWLESEYEGRRTYLRTLNDRCNPAFLQDIWLEKSGVKWDVRDLESDHYPFVSRVEEVGTICLEIFGAWKEG
ncbi:hypothetical protein B0J11DRAFT_517282 [Dendryphion nanum]|uniref:AB hydrolase-1 domain-containing protein n=1 Tax=Dendryphion nanum TaxID=256645 RepID=A0A9P9ED83_9PLEO|nr:hypothetical protein B0J11DRAFT_517282 [Dendryphion nanum]